MDGRSAGNYEKQVYLARNLFLKYDQEEMIRKFNLASDEQFIYIELLHQRCRIQRNTGVVEQSDLDGIWTPCENYELVMTVYDALCCSAVKPELSGEWAPLYGLQATMSSPSPDKIFTGYADTFNGKTEALARACLALGGEPQSVPKSADVCSKIPVFSFFPVIFQFWEGDEEFAPKIMILWDRKALDFMHFETLYYVAGLLLQSLDRMCAANG